MKDFQRRASPLDIEIDRNLSPDLVVFYWREFSLEIVGRQFKAVLKMPLKKVMTLLMLRSRVTNFQKAGLFIPGNVAFFLREFMTSVVCLINLQ